MNLKLKGITPRKYQEDIFGTCKNNNCLVVLPTGTGKTLIPLLLTIERLNSRPDGKILFLAPTRPLALQQKEYFMKHLDTDVSIELFTGKVNAKKRVELWKKSQIIFGTPQGLQNDLKNGLYDLKDVILLVEDECHRCLKSYAYTFVVQKYKEQGINQRIVGLTASPGGDEEKIKLILSNLNIDRIELRTRESPDVEPYMQDLLTHKVYVNLPSTFSGINISLKNILDNRIAEIRKFGYLRGPTTKKFILEEQKKIMKEIQSGKKESSLYWAVSLCSQAIKIDHAIELLETQTLATLNDFIHDIFKQAAEGANKASKTLVIMPEFIQVNNILQALIASGVEHPKIAQITNIVKEQLQINPQFKAIVFSQFRTTAASLVNVMNKQEISTALFVGQAKKSALSGDTGYSQKEQSQIIQDFKDGKIKILCSTSIGEEGLDIPEVNAVVFYEPIPSAIRKIQRIGRTARLMKGAVYILITSGTRDEWYHYSSIKKENKMYKVIEEINNQNKDKKLFS